MQLKPPLVSVVIPAFNVEKYIAACIDSIQAQNHQNVEIICVSDGSTDETETIVSGYVNSNSNVILITQENSGRGSARNAGLRAASGRYLQFVDADDLLPADGISILLKSIMKERSDYVIGHMRSFNDKRSWLYLNHQKFFNNYMGTADLDYAPYIIRDTTVCNKLFDVAFLKREALTFKPRMAKEDFVFTAQAAVRATRITIVPEVVYSYRARNDPNNISGTQRLNDKFFSDFFLASRIAGCEISEKKNYNRILFHKDSEVVRMLGNRILKKFKGVVLSDELKVSLDMFRQQMSEMDTDALYSLPDRQYAFYQQLSIGNDQSALECLNNSSVRHTIQRPRDEADAEPGIASAIRKIARKLRPSKKQILLLLLRNQKLINLPFKNDTRPIWLIGERFASFAGDNGFILFEYLQRHHSADVASYFVLKRSADQYAALKHHPAIVRYGSLKHLHLIFSARVFLFSDKVGDVCPAFLAAKMAIRPDIERTHVMLHHGYMYLKSTSFINYHRNNMRIPVDAFVANSDLEKNYLVEHSGYDPEQIVVAGFCRYDQLLEHVEHREYILFMPTWRRGMKDWSEDEFRNSEYFTKIDEILKDSELHKILHALGIKIKFIVHFNMLNLLHCFKSESSVVEIVKPGTDTVGNLLNHCAMLITDYSTVSFDVAYMDKAVIFYDLGTETENDVIDQGPISEHYLDELFAPTLHDKAGLIQTIGELGENDFHLSGEYRLKRSAFFQNIDANNTRRTVKHVMALSHSTL